MNIHTLSAILFTLSLSVSAGGRGGDARGGMSMFGNGGAGGRGGDGGGFSASVPAGFKKEKN